MAKKNETDVQETTVEYTNRAFSLFQDVDGYHVVEITYDANNKTVGEFKIVESYKERMAANERFKICVVQAKLLG